MKELTLTLNYVYENPIYVPFLLQTVPSVTPADAKSPIRGQWFCQSRYIGNTFGGTYYFKDMTSVPCTTQEDHWMKDCSSPLNPVGFFFDASDSPFLLLQGMDLAPCWIDTGWGKILRYAVERPLSPVVAWEYDGRGASGQKCSR